MNKLTLAAVAACALFVSAPAAAANLITNGSFDNGFTGWTLTTAGGGSAPVVINYGSTATYPAGAFGEAIKANTVASRSPDAVGSTVAYFSSDTANPHALSQTIDLVAGRTYDIGFDYYAPRNGINTANDSSLSFFVGGVPVGATLTAGGVSGTAAATWLNFNTFFTATASGPQTISFQFRGLGSNTVGDRAADFAVDRVYATAAVPEPATWLTMIMGFGAIGGTLRRRRTKLAFA